MSEPVIVTDSDGVRTIRLSRPEKKNALTQAMYAELTRVLREADAANSIRCVMLAGAPGAFCAGNDIGDFIQAAQGGSDMHAFGFIEEIARNKTPKVAAVGGVAVGVGTTMLLHCDHVVASTEATFSTPFLKLGLLPEAASTLLAPMRMGYARAFAMLAMGRPMSAAEAKEAGLVNAVVAAADVDAVATQAAREIAALPPKALAVTRSLMRGNLDEIAQRLEVEAMHFRNLLQSDEARAAFQAFLARKK